jgi:hypothetical protein
MIMLTVSDAPTSARQANVSQNERDKPKRTVASPNDRDRPQQRLPAAIDPLGERHHGRAHHERAGGRSGIQPAVAFRADAEDVLREDRQQRHRRRKERGEEIEQHRRSDERRLEHESQTLHRRVQRDIVSRRRGRV